MGILEIATVEVLVLDSGDIELLDVARQGPPGPPGTGGGTGDLSYTHAQTVPAALWLVAHNLGKYPSTTVVDSAGSVVIGDVSHADANNLQLTFSGAFAGTAYLN